MSANPATSAVPCITVLMAVYNGAPYLEAQLDSIATQTHPHWRVLASDDRSTDTSRAVLEQVAARWAAQGGNTLEILAGPQDGAAENFMSLLRYVQRTTPQTDWIAFADQDDVWLPDKLARATAQLAQHDADVPALYCSRTWIMSPDMAQRRLSAPRPRAPGFRNALVQNIAAGNTIVLNPAASRMVLEAAERAGQVVVHDWWVYQLVTGAGGTVIHDDTPSLLYRQHGGNEIGANDTTAARLKRIRQLLRGDFQQWNRINIAALNRTPDLIRPANTQILADFAQLSSLPLWRRLIALKRLGLYRQSLPATGALWLATVLGRL